MRRTADQRIYELLRYKFKLFDGVFGASDAVLGRIEDGIDFEKRISDIFDIAGRRKKLKPPSPACRQKWKNQSRKNFQRPAVLFGNFDEDVHARLRLHKEQAITRRDEMLDAFWHLTKYILIHQLEDKFIGLPF